MPPSSFTDLFLDAARRAGGLNAAGVDQARTVWLRLRDSGHQVPISVLLVALGLLEDSAIESVESAVAGTPFQCPACQAVGDGADVLKFRSLNCSRCGRPMTPQIAPEEGTGKQGSPVPSVDSSAATMLRDRPISPADTTRKRTPVSSVAPPGAASAAHSNMDLLRAAGAARPIGQDTRPNGDALGRGAQAPREGLSPETAPAENRRLPVVPLRRLRFTGTIDEPVPGDERLIGTRLGRYKILSLLGTGGWGNVYLGQHDTLGTQFAIKVLNASLTREGEYVQRFLSEARITATLDHPNIRRTLDVAEERGLHYMVMEYVDGEGLQTLVEQNGRLEPALAVPIARFLAEGLENAVRRGIIHRDIKPRNVLVSRDGQVKLTDFGLAKVFVSGADITASGAILGTPEYMSPEQFEGARADLRSDIYSLGCTFFFMLTGRPPFEGPDFPQLMRQHKGASPPSPLRFNKRIPPSLCAVLSRMLAKRPGNRYQEYREVVEALGQAMSTEGPAALPVPDVRPSDDEDAAERWMDDERVKRCAEIQDLFTSEGMMPPPRWHLMLALGYAKDERPSSDDLRKGRVVFSCGKCREKVQLQGTLPEAGLVCPECGGAALTHPWFGISFQACFTQLSLNREAAANPLALQAIVRTAALVCFSGRHNVILDFTACASFPNEVIGGLMSLREQLTEDRVAPVLLVSPKALKTVTSLGLDEFLLVCSSRDEVTAKILAGELCPHLRYFLGAVKGYLGETEEEIAVSLDRSSGCCVKREPFVKFYANVLPLLKRREPEKLRASLDDLERSFATDPGTCLPAVAARVRVLAEGGLREKMERMAFAHLRKDQVDRAEAAAQRIAEAFPDSSAAQDILGQSAMRRGKPSEAATYFARAAEHSAAPAEFLLNKAVAYRRSGHIAKAIAELDALLAEAPDHVRALLFKGTLHFERHDYTRALNHFERAAARAPEDAQVLFWRGRAHHRLGEMKLSLADFEAAAALDPNDARILSNCGAIAVRLQEYDRAVEYLQRAIDANPSLPGPHYNLGCASCARGDKEAALEALARAVELGWSKGDLMRRDRMLAPLRDDPRHAARFEEIVGRIRTGGADAEGEG